MMQTGRPMRLLAYAVTVLFLSAAAHGQGPGIVAQLVAVRGGSLDQVRIERERHSFVPRSYEPLYVGDQLVVLRGGVVAEVEFSGGRVESVDARRSPFMVTGVQSTNWSMPQFRRLLALFPSILSPPRNVQGGETLPAPWRGGALRFSEVLPGVAQSLAPSQHPVVIPVVWNGGPAAVKLIDSYGSVVAQKSPALAGFGVLFVPTLDAGQYIIRITPTTSAATDLIIPVAVSGAPASDGPAGAEQVLQAVDALKGDPRGRLRALIELQENSDREYIAYAALRAISQGTVP